MKSKHTCKWIIHIKLKFCWEGRLFWDKRKEIGLFLRGNKLVSYPYLKKGYNYFYEVNRQTFAWVFTCESEKKYIWNWSKMFGIFHLFHYSFMKSLIKSIIYCQTVPLNRFYLCVLKIACQASLPLVFKLSKSGNILFRSMPNWCCLFILTSIVIGRR